MEEELEFLGRARAARRRPQEPEQAPEVVEVDYSHLTGVVDPAIIEAFKRDDRRKREAGERWGEDGED